MKSEKPSSEDLRCRAEARMNSLARPTLEVPTTANAMRQLHELQVHQVELEMQNEDLQQTRASLEEALASYTDLYDFAPVGYLSLDPTGGITRANLAAGRMLGLERSRLLTRRFAGFLAEADALAFTAYLEQAFKDQPLEPFEGRLRVEGALPLQVQVVAALSSDGQKCRLVLTDVTELRRSQEQEKRLEAELQHSQKLESLGSLAGGVAHDMNNVLAAIQAVSETLQLTHGTDASLVHFLEIIDRASARGRDLVKGLANFARKDLREPEPLDLNAVVREASELLRQTTLQKVELVLDLEEDLPWVLGEQGPLASALMNLCLNAVDAMPLGGTLTLRTRRLPSAHVELAVQDTGVGMTPQVLARATEPFFTTKPLGKGTGLGLAMAYATVKAHGGVMGLQSEPGKGTLITLNLPAGAVSWAPDAAPPAGGPKAASLQILLVDDDELIRDTLPAMVEFSGHHVISATGGQAALDMLEAGLEVQLVILDLNMPGMNGLETLQKLRQRLPWLPVLLSTGHLDADTSRALQQAGRTLSITKPYTLEELDQKLREIMRLEGL